MRPTTSRTLRCPGGDDSAKPRQVEFNYNDILPDGVLKGCHPSSTYSHDIDCGDAKEQERIKGVLLEMKEEIGLLELSGSARYGLHAVKAAESRERPSGSVSTGAA